MEEKLRKDVSDKLPNLVVKQCSTYDEKYFRFWVTKGYQFESNICSCVNLFFVCKYVFGAKVSSFEYQTSA